MGLYLQKIKWDLKEAIGGLEMRRTKGKKIVFTNGCFDILHSGHIYYLNEARALGDYLVVGVNSDSSVTRLKGHKRPILPLKERLEILSGLEMVDMLIPFEEDTPLNLIETISPSVLVKGGDYTIPTIVGAEYVLKNGGEVKVLSFKEGSSTTNIIETILNRYQHDKD